MTQTVARGKLQPQGTHKAVLRTPYEDVDEDADELKDGDRGDRPTW